MARKVTAMDIKMLVATLPEDANVAEWCRRLGISRPTAYKWRDRYRAEGVAGLEDRSRAPERPFGRVSPTTEDAVVAARKQLADEGFDCGPASVHDRLEALGLEPPSEATIWRIGVRRGQITPQPKKRPRASFASFQRERPNECWQGDDTHYVLATGKEVRIINIVDDHSRVNVDALAAWTCTSERVWEAFCRGAARHGVPQEFLNDNGRAYISPRGETPVVFQSHLARLGVRHLHSSPRHPQTCGKVERFHQTQRRWLDAQPVAKTLEELQELLDRGRVIYNTQRRHKSIGRLTPATVWAAQPPAEPCAPPTTAPPAITSLRVDGNGVVHVATGLRIALGAPWANTQVVVIRRAELAIVIDAVTGEIARELTVDPNRSYQPTGARRGGPRQPRRREV
jgi:transposase InsO family protein